MMLSLIMATALSVGQAESQQADISSFIKGVQQEKALFGRLRSRRCSSGQCSTSYSDPTVATSKIKIRDVEPDFPVPVPQPVVTPQPRPQPDGDVDVDVLVSKIVDLLKREPNIRGPQGPPGTDGSMGPQGPTGDQGPAGIRGSTGDRGADGIGLANIVARNNMFVFLLSDGREIEVPMPAVPVSYEITRRN